MGDYGEKISRSGFDVKTATDKQLVLTSKFKTFTIASSGSGNAIVLSGNYRERLEVAHGLGYVPAYAVYGKISTETEYKKVPYTSAKFDISYPFLYCWADSTKIYMELQYGLGAPSNTTANFKYYIFNNQIE